MRALKQNLLGIFLAAFFLWLVFFLVNGLPNSSFVGPGISKDCSWKSVALDANLDGIFTYSDIPAWIGAIFVGFQKFLVANLYGTTVGQFIELNKNTCRAFKAQAIAFITLLAIFYIISKITLSFVNAIIPKINSIQKKNSLTAEVSYLDSSRNFVDAVWALQFKLVFITLIGILIGLNWQLIQAFPASLEEPKAVKKSTKTPPALEPSNEQDKLDYLREDANNSKFKKSPSEQAHDSSKAKPNIPIAENYEYLVLELVNKERSTGATCGDTYFQPTSPLSKNQKLADSALAHAHDMAVNDYFSHESKNGEKLKDRVNKQGYSWLTIGENIAKGQKTSAQVVREWMNSPGHCKNIMNPNFGELGVGRDDNLRKEYIWVQVFGNRK
jgi:uncharacterized protein YkwD